MPFIEAKSIGLAELLLSLEELSLLVLANFICDWKGGYRTGFCLFIIEEVKSNSLEPRAADVPSLGLLFRLRLELKVAIEDKQTIEVSIFGLNIRDDLMMGNVLWILDSSRIDSSSCGGILIRSDASSLVNKVYIRPLKQIRAISSSLSRRGKSFLFFLR